MPKKKNTDRVQYSIRLDRSIFERIEKLRPLIIEKFLGDFSENAIIRSLVNRGLQALERELLGRSQKPSIEPQGQKSQQPFIEPPSSNAGNDDSEAKSGPTRGKPDI